NKIYLTMVGPSDVSSSCLELEFNHCQVGVNGLSFTNGVCAATAEIGFGSMTNGTITGVTAGTYNTGTNLSITAVSEPNYAFNGWLNAPAACVNNSASCSFTVDQSYPTI